MTNSVHAERLQAMIQEIHQIVPPLPSEHVDHWRERVAEIVDTLTDCLIMYKAMPDGCSVLEMVEGHSMLQSTLFYATRELVRARGSSGAKTSLKLLNRRAIGRMMAMYRCIDHKTLDAQYHDAMLDFVKEGGKL